MTTKTIGLSAIALGAAVGLGACGGGSGGTSLFGGTSAGTAQGVITGFGSVFVNGVEYEVDGSTDISVDGSSGTEDSLEVGMVVTVQGSVSSDGKTGRATRIEFADELEGIVQANNVAADGTGTLQVMAQTVELDAQTVFSSHLAGVASPDQIQAGNIVEVSGYSSGTGTIYATRVEVEAASLSDVSEVKGLVSGLDTGAKTFSLGALTVDYSSAQLEGFPGGVPENGMYVEVKSTQGMTGNTLIASKVEREGDGDRDHDGDEGDDYEVKGRITSPYANGQFQCNGQTIVVDANTRFEHGSHSQLAEGVLVEVEGYRNADGHLLAHEISFEHEGELSFEGRLESVGSDSVTLLGQSVRVTNDTIRRDDRDEGTQPVRYFDLGDLASGDHIEVHAYRDSSGDLVATKLERDDDHGGGKSEVEGTASSVSGHQIVVAGVYVDLSGVAFRPAEGTRVEVEGVYSDGVLTATEASRDD